MGTVCSSLLRLLHVCSLQTEKLVDVTATMQTLMCNDTFQFFLEFMLFVNQINYSIQF